MAQTTPKNLEDALHWIHTQEHHASGLEPEHGPATHRWFKNHFNTLRIRISHEWAGDFFNLIEPNPRPHDDRMYALTRMGRDVMQIRLGRAGKPLVDWTKHP